MKPRRSSDPSTDMRRKILARATLYLYGFLAAAVLVAVGGAALMAWLLARIGLPFRETWIVLAIIIVLPSAIMMIVRGLRDGKRRS